MTKADDQVDAPGSGAQQRGERTRRLIIEAATGLAAERGWDAVSTRQIAERAGVNQALIHYHFGSKEALLHAAFRTALRDMFSGPVAALSAAPTFREGALGLVRAIAEMDDTSPEALFSMEALSRATRDETLRSGMAELLAELRAVVADRIRGAQAAGELRGDLDPEGAATALGALFDGLGLHLLIDRSIDVERTAAAIDTLLSPDPREHEETP